MIKHIFGYFNRKADCFEHFAIFDNFKQLVDYDNALVRCSKSKECEGFEFANYILYPEDYTLYNLGSVNYVPVNPTDWFTGSFVSCGDYVDCLGINKKGVEEDVESVKRDADICDSEQVYSDSEPRA